MAGPTRHDLTVWRGDDWDFPMRLQERDPDGTLGDYVDLTGCTAKAQVRTAYDSATVAAEMVAVIDPDQVGNKGKLALSLTHLQTDDLADSYVWDFQITDAAGKVRTYLYGSFTASRDTTR